ncbi:phosphate transporter PHO1 homolog 10 isoform X1 [Ziziphus jujuba]|uniref:Phosphate transporter PHO1 homolog 10 isoform X1 n=1 Tax=Ziziphus jujuba TaxID=326968 RepID=A0ABM3ZXM6_ZIZJJ|nr:phosphate transporter PHO1 homolog 10 isoform X1 [Ziziphus jujuba]XP_048318126.2 phosphate transporter PHO1 homolog 10 isoform X1 [Ziziphus jujuba]XP_060669228.1 phosphate transporter PHO1 homolog 10 isoform X1 [Ziziphus jujuba]XP_060669229.1 phosphate transporter PHO1 homolog 10 isoform X1 [Ziziphus jujuba]
MKFGEEFKKHKVPEWTEAYMDYNGLKRILREIRQHKQKKHPEIPSRASQHRTTSNMFPSELSHQSSSPHNQRDIEDQVIDINTLHRDGSRQYFETNFLKQFEEGGEIEVMFFRKLDEELNKVNSFYKDKVEEVTREESELSKQMDALIALRIKVAQPNVDGASSKRQNASAMPLTGPDDGHHVGHRQHSAGDLEIIPVSSCSRECRKEANSNDNKEDPLEILDHVKINNTLESPISTIKGVFKDSKEDELSFNREELKKAEEKLRVAFIEFYHKLHLLKHYSFMNLSAFSKIMKKYEKTTSRRASRSYMKIVDNSYIGNSDEITGLLEKVEAIFIKNFTNSNRKKGMKSLRPKAREEKHTVTFFSGFFSGCTIALLVAIILRLESLKLLNKKEGMQYIQSIFPLYSLFLYTVLHMLMYAADLYFWRKYQINYPFIFGFKRGTELGYREVFLLSTGLSVLALAGFLANLHLDMQSSTQKYKKVTELVPLGLVTLVLVITFCPFNIIYRSSRFFFIRCTFRCLCAPLYPVTLQDFFLADQLTSQMQAFRSLVLYICYYGLGEYSRRQNKCHSHGVYNTLYYVVAIIPFWLRFLQCIRRLCEDKDKIHGFNALKYLSTIVAVLIRTASELKRQTSWMVLALVSSAIAIIFNTYWDIVVDWGLLRMHSKNIYLRDRLLVSHKSIYVVAMVANILLRIAWMQLVLEFKLHPFHKMTIITIISCLEIIRRGIWSFFRLENEHLNNVGKYRAFKSVPLPFYYSDDDDNKDD